MVSILVLGLGWLFNEGSLVLGDWLGEATVVLTRTLVTLVRSRSDWVTKPFKGKPLVPPRLKNTVSFLK